MDLELAEDKSIIIMLCPSVLACQLFVLLIDLRPYGILRRGSSRIVRALAEDERELPQAQPSEAPPSGAWRWVRACCRLVVEYCLNVIGEDGLPAGVGYLFRSSTGHCHPDLVLTPARVASRQGLKSTT